MGDVLGSEPLGSAPLLKFPGVKRPWSLDHANFHNFLTRGLQGQVLGTDYLSQSLDFIAFKEWNSVTSKKFRLKTNTTKNTTPYTFL